MTITLTLSWLDVLWITPLTLYALWWNFIATMSIRERWPLLTRTNKTLAALPVVLSFLQDVFANVVIATVFGAERPHEWTLTERFQRWKAMAETSPRRYKVARWACKHINQFDEGHC